MESGGVVLGHAEGEGFEAAEEEVAAVGVDDTAHGFVEGADFFDQCFGAEDGAGEEVVVAGEVFGAAMHDKVDAEFEGALVHGGGEGAIDDGEDVVAAGDFAEADEVEDVEVGVGG